MWSIFKEILPNRLSLTWDWPRVMSMAPIVKILNRRVRPELFSLSLLRVALVKANKCKEAFFWPIAVISLFWDTHRRMRLSRGGTLSTGCGRKTWIKSTIKKPHLTLGRPLYLQYYPHRVSLRRRLTAIGQKKASTHITGDTCKAGSREVRCNVYR